MYDKLYLAKGGGIVSEAQQAEQADDAVSLLIGLGGTGIDCIRAIKSQVYKQIKPDADSGEVPKYDHIRFLGVDADNQVMIDEEGNTNYLRLAEDELFNLPVVSIEDLKNVSGKSHGCYEWMADELTSQNLAERGTGGYRQVGRYLLMLQADTFMDRVRHIINTMRAENIDKRVEIHVFSGMSGGTGSGIFLDVCYMLKEITKNFVEYHGEPIVDVLGYFFLPDINISKSDQNYLRGNGYAAMQELDYCMNLRNNGGAFTQVMPGGRAIEWKEAPVDFCYLISSVNSEGNIPENAYDYAMQAVSEYVLDFFAVRGAFRARSLLSSLSYIIMCEEAQKGCGYNIRYFSIGGACGIVPVKEINTYLAAKIYSTFDMEDKQPTQDKVDDFAIALWKAPNMQKPVLDCLYAGIMNIIQQGGASKALEPYDGKAAEALKNQRAFKLWYEQQVTTKNGILEENEKMYLMDSNKTSFAAQMKEILNGYLENIDMGPTYVCNLLNGANGHNFINTLDALIAKAQYDYNDEYGYDASKYDALIKAEQEFINVSGLDKLRIGKLFKVYETRLADYSNHRYKLRLYECIKEMLIKCKAKTESLWKNYYNKLNAIYQECKDTFSENLNYLTTTSGTFTTNDFYEEIISVQDENLQRILNVKINAIDSATVFKGMIHSWIANEDAWKTETTIAKMITDYFVGQNGIFADFASKTIQDYLEVQYDTNDIGEIANRFNRDWIDRLKGKAASLFACDTAVFTGGNIGYQHIAIPTTAPSIKIAAVGLTSKTPKWELIDSLDSARILLMSITCAFPICASFSVNTYQEAKYKFPLPGRHLYEQNNNEGKGIFRDWRKLPPLLPYSLYDFSKLDDDNNDNALTELSEVMKRTRWIIQKEEEYHLVDDDGYIYDLSDAYIEKVDDLAGGMRAIETNSEQQSAEELSERVKSIKEAMEQLHEMPKLRKTEVRLNMLGRRERQQDISRLRKDAIGYSPCYQMKLKRTIQQVDETEQKIEAIKAKCVALEKKVQLRTIVMGEFVYAICTGVIWVSGMKVAFEKIDDGGTMGEVVLSDKDGKYKYGKYLPIYQAFKNFSRLDEQTYEYVVKQNIEKKREDRKALKEKAKELGIVDAYSDEWLNSWIQMANIIYPEDVKEVQEFVCDFKDQFTAFCTKNQIK